MQSKNLEISQKSVITTILLLVGAYIVWRLRDLLVLIFIAVIFTAALNPLVSALQKRKVPRNLAIFTVYLALISFVVTIFSLILPPLIRESITLFSKLDLPQLPVSFEFSDLQNTLQSYNELLSGVGGSIPGLFNAIFTTFSGLLVVFTFFVMTYYMLIERHHLHHYFAWIFGRTNAEKKAQHFLNSLEHDLGGWIRGQLLLTLIIGAATYLGLTILGIPYALPLGILAGLLEVVPNIGPTIAAIPAILLAFLTLSPATGVIVLLFYILVQQLENNIIVPKVMSRSTNISPLIAIIVLIAGVKLGGIRGTILSIPTYILLRNLLLVFSNGDNPFHFGKEVAEKPKDL